MNLSQLRAFDAVYRTGSYTAAARRLFITQPAVTNHVKALESYYQVKLFRREGRGVVPTELGEHLADVSQRLFALEEEASDLLAGTRALRRGTLRIAADGPYLVVPLVAAFRERFPGLRVNLSIGNTADVQAALLDERCDISVQAHVEPDPRVRALPIASYRIIIFVARTHAWARSGREAVAMAELDGQPMILREPGSTTRRRFVEACAAAGVQPEFVVETTSRETVKESVAAGLGIGVISEGELRRDPRFHPLLLDDADLTYTEQVLCLTRRENLRAIAEFLRVARELTSLPDSATVVA